MATAVGSIPQQYLNLRPFNLDPVIPVIRQILGEIQFLEPLKITRDILDSSALVNVSLVSLKNIPSVYFGNHEIVKELDNSGSPRLRYFEAALTSLAAAVYNCVFGLFFSAVSLVTLGQIKLIVAQMRKHWIHSSLSVGALFISCVGTASPEMGIRANLGFAFVIGLSFFQRMQDDTPTRICNAYQRHHRELRGAVLQTCSESGVNFNNEFAPFFNYLDINLNHRVRTVSEFTNILRNIEPHLPRVMPFATPSVIVDNLVGLISDYRSAGNSSAEPGTSSTPAT